LGNRQNGDAGSLRALEQLPRQLHAPPSLMRRRRSFGGRRRNFWQARARFWVTIWGDG
jgi:hypothetical protein